MAFLDGADIDSPTYEAKMIAKFSDPKALVFAYTDLVNMGIPKTCLSAAGQRFRPAPTYGQFA